jgi:hypothetical protein
MSGGHPPTSAAPTMRRGPYTAVRIGYAKTHRSVSEARAIESNIGNAHREVFFPSEVQGAASAVSWVVDDAETNSSRRTAAGLRVCFPLSGKSLSQTQSDPTVGPNQQLRGFAETEVAAPAPDTEPIPRSGFPGLTPLAATCDSYLQFIPVKRVLRLWRRCSIGSSCCLSERR